MATDVNPLITTELPGPPGRWEHRAMTLGSCLGIFLTGFLLTLMGMSIAEEQARSASAEASYLTGGTTSNECLYTFTHKDTIYTAQITCQYKGESERPVSTVGVKYEPSDPDNVAEASSETAWTFLFLLGIPVALITLIPSVLWLTRWRNVPAAP